MAKVLASVSIPGWTLLEHLDQRHVGVLTALNLIRSESPEPDGLVYVFTVLVLFSILLRRLESSQRAAEPTMSQCSDLLLQWVSMPLG